MIAKGDSEAFSKLQSTYSELNENILKSMCDGTYDVLSNEL
jgi:hypothetical protein